jgi:hypothetical protein
VLLVDQRAVPDLSGYAATLPIFTSLTSLAIGGQYLQLRDSAGMVISWVEYNPDWYADPLKTGGGWSLEKINPDLKCSQQSNWKASTHRNGGTPGEKNSVMSSVFNVQQPEMTHIAVHNEREISLYVSNPLGSILPETTQFSIEPKVERLEVAGRHFNQIRLYLESSLIEGITYNIKISGNIFDCADYVVKTDDFHFQRPQDVEHQDVIINEILFNPATDGYSFVELYNRSNKSIELNDLQMSMRNNNGQLSNPVLLTDEPLLLLPDNYVVISRNIDDVMLKFNALKRAPFLQMRTMPALTRTSGRIVILDRSLNVIDEVHYNANQHTDFLNVSAGVSLERLNPNRSSLEAGNWNTASQMAGFGTPGKRNSQYIELTNNSINEVTLEPEIFSPENGQTLNIKYHFDTPSLIGEVIIFDSTGRDVRKLISGQILYIEDTITWNGDDDNGRRLAAGIYIVFFRAYNSSGVQKLYKIPCVLAQKK